MKWLSRVSDLLAQGKVFCLATTVASDGTDLPVGRKAIVLPDGTMEGAFGSARLDRVVRDLARKALAERQSDTVTVGDGARCISTSCRLTPNCSSAVPAISVSRWPVLPARSGSG